jgi:hypothetical protein
VSPVGQVELSKCRCALRETGLATRDATTKWEGDVSGHPRMRRLLSILLILMLDLTSVAVLIHGRCPPEIATRIL